MTGEPVRLRGTAEPPSLLNRKGAEAQRFFFRSVALAPSQGLDHESRQPHGGADEALLMIEQPQTRADRANQAAFELIGAAIEVHRHLGPGYLESVYEEALCVELGLRN